MKSSNNYYHLSTYQQPEIIKKIEFLGGQYDPDTNLPLEEQLLICESLAETDKEYQIKESVSVNGSGNDSYKRTVNFELTQNKLQIINELRSYNYKSPIYKITKALQDLFKECESKQTHWSYIAEHYTPRTISRVINYMIKHYGNWTTIQNPAAYFTKSIKWRKKRKSL